MGKHTPRPSTAQHKVLDRLDSKPSACLYHSQCWPFSVTLLSMRCGRYRNESWLDIRTFEVLKRNKWISKNKQNLWRINKVGRAAIAKAERKP